MLDEPLFTLELGEPRYPLTKTIDDNDDDDENRFVVNDTGVDPSQQR
jgi:hypothetical protein